MVGTTSSPSPMKRTRAPNRRLSPGLESSLIKGILRCRVVVSNKPAPHARPSRIDESVFRLSLPPATNLPYNRMQVCTDLVDKGS